MSHSPGYSPSLRQWLREIPCSAVVHFCPYPPPRRLYPPQLDPHRVPEAPLSSAFPIVDKKPYRQQERQQRQLGHSRKGTTLTNTQSAPPLLLLIGFGPHTPDGKSLLYRPSTPLGGLSDQAESKPSYATCRLPHKHVVHVRTTIS